MRQMIVCVSVAVMTAALGCGGGQPGGGDESIPEPPDVDVPDPAVGDEAEPDKVISFTADVMPILKASCVGCHGQAKGLSLESHDAVLAGSENGPVIVGGKPGDSPLVHYIEGTKEPRMPQGADPLTDDQITTIRTWILQGAAGD
jgi:mono/diheme cytochrome c family protein